MSKTTSAATVLAGLLAAGQSQAVTLAELIAARDNAVKLVYKSVDGTNLHVHVYAPAEAAGKRPAIMMIHGGGWAAPGPFHMAAQCRYFAARGLVAVNVEYRLVGQNTAIRIPDCVADCRDALRFVRQSAERLGVDPARIAVAGDSAGGHLAAALALLPDPGQKDSAPPDALPNALVLYNPVVDLAALQWMPGHPGVAALPDSPAGETWRERADRVAPIRHVRAGLPPTLLIHGTKDSCVPVEQADRFAERMREAGNRIEYRRMEGWDHAFVIPNYGKDEQIVEALRMTDAFLAELGYLQETSNLTAGWRPAEHNPLFTPQGATAAARPGAESH